MFLFSSVQKNINYIRTNQTWKCKYEELLKKFPRIAHPPETISDPVR